ncbi:MAG TPA: hypothetical protein VF062_28970 [Candidatus Limnocylindrales bacterium]
MNRGNMQLISDGRAIGEGIASRDADRLDASLEELIRRARLQASDLSLMIQRLERLRRDVRQTLSESPATD